MIGGGIIGLAIAREAARSGLTVRLLERGEPGGEASSAAAGMLGAQIDAGEPGPFLDLLLASRDLYPAFVEEVRLESDMDVRLSDHSTLVVARSAANQGRLTMQANFQRSLGLPVEQLDGDGVHRLEPELAGDIRAGLLLPRDSSVDNAVLVRALAVAAARGGVMLHRDRPASSLITDGETVTGVVAGGDRFEAAAVVIAAGAWSGQIAGEGVPPLPTHPMRGQIVSLASGAVRRIVVDEECYLVPRGQGRLLVGSTMENAGFDRRVTADGISGLAAAASRLAPALAVSPILSSWAGLRPATADGLPAIGPGPHPGLFYACGHLRNGILLAPITARVVVASIRGEAPPIDVSSFDPRRLLPQPA